MGITELIRCIADNGVLIVIAAIFLYTSIKIINIFLRKLESKMCGKQHDKLIDIRYNIDQKIQLLLDNFIIASEGDRVQVIEFSNSVMSIAYLPFKYMTCTYEVYRPGFTSTSSVIDRLSTSLFTTFFTNMQTNDYCIIDRSDTLASVGGAMQDLVLSSGEPNALCTLLRTCKGKCIGFIMLKKSTEFTADNIDNIQELGHQISALLSVVDN